MTQKRKHAKTIKTKDNDETSVEPKDEIGDPLDNDDEVQMNPIPTPWRPPLDGLTKEQWQPKKDEPLEIDLTKTKGFPPLRIVDKDKVASLDILSERGSEYMTIPDPDIEYNDEEEEKKILPPDDYTAPPNPPEKREPTDMTSVTVSALSLGMLKTNKALLNYLLRCELNNDQVLLLTSMITNYIFEVKILRTEKMSFMLFFRKRFLDLYLESDYSVYEKLLDNQVDVLAKLNNMLNRICDL